MKKIASIIVLFIAFSFSVKAQESKTTANSSKTSVIQSNAIVNELDAVVKLSPQLKQDLMTLYAMREEALNNVKTTEEKKQICERIGKKILAGLTDEQRALLDKSPDLIKRLKSL